MSPNKKWVIKIPRISDGRLANREEASLYRQFGSRGSNPLDGLHYARCRLIPNTDVLVMEAVDVSRFNQMSYRDYPVWTEQVDSGQCGFTRLGRLVAFDFSDC